jgi:hypothetical protein
VANLVLPVPHQAHFFLRAPLRGGEALHAARAPGKLALSWWSDQQRERPPAGAGSGERARAACMGFRDVVVGALRPSGSAGSTGGRRACWTWTCGSAGGRVAGRRRAWSRRGAGRCSVTAGSSSSAAVVEAAARSRRSSTPEQTRDGRPSNASARRAPEVLHQRAHSKKADAIERGLRPPNLFQCILHTEARVETPRNNIWPFLATPPPRASGAPRRASAVAVGETDVPPPCCAPPLRTPLLLRAARPGRLLLSPSGRSPPAGGARAYGMTSVALATSPL